MLGNFVENLSGVSKRRLSC